jgi:hypothetical protein
MLIKNINKFINQITHSGKIHKVVEGIAEVPSEVADHLLKFPDWSKVVEPVDDKIIKELNKVTK